jgi:hypothetical protein
MMLARALTPLQETVLTTVVTLCPDSGQETRDAVVAERHRLSRRTVVLSVIALQKLGLLHAIREADHRVLRPTWNGRKLAHVLSANERSASDEGAEA